MNLRSKLMLGGVLIVFVPLLVVGVFSALKSSNAMEEAGKFQSRVVAKNIADLLQTAMEDQMKIARQIASATDIVDAAKAITSGSGGEAAGNAIAGRLGSAHRAVGDYEQILFIGTDGKIAADSIGGSTKGTDVNERQYFKDAKEGKASAGQVVKSKISGNPVGIACVPVLSDAREFLGALVLVIKIEHLAGIVGSYKSGKTGYAWVVDKTGLLIVHPRKEFILELNLAKEAGMKDIMEKMLAQQAGDDDYVFKGDKKIAGFAPVKLTGWSVGVTQNADEFLASSHSIRNFIVVVALIFLALVAIVVFYFARSVAVPIQTAVDQMQDAAGQVAAASNQVASSSQSLAEGASEQASAIEETSSSLEEMSSMTKQNAGNASQADSLMKHANQVVQKANLSMEELTRSMRDISTASTETSKIIKTIDEIAFQTNLLALNAAVEAARAGEAGAGFAVVADEVRNLAQRAAEAAKNTSVMIEDTVKKIKDGSDLVIRTNEAFAEIAQNATKVGELIGEISAASQEQAQGIDQINRAVNEMDKVTQQTAANAEESASASEEMHAQTEQMKHTAVVLAHIIGVSSNGAGSSSGNGKPDRRGVRRLVASMAPKIEKIQNKGISPRAKSLPTKAERLIPMTDEQFKDF
jgi:methyl-accepting chemotaxis protein